MQSTVKCERDIKIRKRDTERVRDRDIQIGSERCIQMARKRTYKVNEKEREMVLVVYIQRASERGIRKIGETNQEGQVNGTYKGHVKGAYKGDAKTNIEGV